MLTSVFNSQLTSAEINFKGGKKKMLKCIQFCNF